MYINRSLYNMLRNKFNPLLSRIQDDLNDFLKEKGYETIQLIDYRFEIQNDASKSDLLGINFSFTLNKDIHDFAKGKIYEDVWNYIETNNIEDKIRGIAIHNSIMKLFLKRPVIDDILDSIKDIK